jgi:hypothetical protein
MKPVVKINDAFILRGMDSERLFGYPLDYPEEHQWYPGCIRGGMIRTGPIVSKEDHIIETERTIYAVLSWESTPEHLKAIK